MIYSLGFKLVAGLFYIIVELMEDKGCWKEEKYLKKYLINYKFELENGQ